MLGPTTQYIKFGRERGRKGEREREGGERRSGGDVALSTKRVGSDVGQHGKSEAERVDLGTAKTKYGKKDSSKSGVVGHNAELHPGFGA